MGTNTRPELSKKNKYWIEKHRYYELKHFCLQYPIWKKAYLALTDLKSRPLDVELVGSENNLSNPTEKIAEARLVYEGKMKMIEDTVRKTDEELYDYILKGVTEGFSYETLKVQYGIPCCRDAYYNAYRRFFSILNKERD